MESTSNPSIIRNENLSFRTDYQTKIRILNAAKQQEMKPSDFLNTIIKNAVDEQGNFTLGIKEEHYRLEAERLKQEKDEIFEDKSALEGEISQLKSTTINFKPKSRKERQILTIHNLFIGGRKEITETELEKLGISGWWDLGFIRTIFGPYVLNKRLFSEKWVIEKLM